MHVARYSPYQCVQFVYCLLVRFWQIGKQLDEGLIETSFLDVVVASHAHLVCVRWGDAVLYCVLKRLRELVKPAVGDAGIGCCFHGGCVVLRDCDGTVKY